MHALPVAELYATADGRQSEIGGARALRSLYAFRSRAHWNALKASGRCLEIIQVLAHGFAINAAMPPTNCPMCDFTMAPSLSPASLRKRSLKPRSSSPRKMKPASGRNYKPDATTLAARFSK